MTNCNTSANWRDTRRFSSFMLCAVAIGTTSRHYDVTSQPYFETSVSGPREGHHSAKKHRRG